MNENFEIKSQISVSFSPVGFPEKEQTLTPTVAKSGTTNTEK